MGADRDNPVPPGSRPRQGLLDRAEALLRARRTRNAAWQQGMATLARRARVALAVLHVGNLLALVAVGLLQPLVGESWWPVGMLLFLPPLAWFLPTLVLAAASLALHRRQLVLAGLALMVFTWAFLRPALNAGGTPAPGDVVAMTYNFGQHNRQSMRPFVELHDPDLLLLQESLGRGPGFARGYPGYHWRAHSEFVLLSRWPILEGDYLAGLEGCAARFVVDAPGGPIAVYNVHLPSPRRELTGLAHPRALLQILAGRTGPGSRLEQFRLRQARRARIAADLRELLARETLPWILGGDFNLPSTGREIRRFTAIAKDAHREAGLGLGYTFPGETDQPLALFRPWLRIDYLFAGPGWEVVDCDTESGRPSQHQAVAARFRR